MLGVIDDVTRRTPSASVADGERIFLLGETREELSGSEWAHVVHGHLGGLPPAVDLAAERRSPSCSHAGVGLLTTAHDLSDGGLAQALVEGALRHGVGATVAVPGDPFVGLFTESAARVARDRRPTATPTRLVELAARHGVPITALGVTGGDALAVEGEFDASRSTELPGAPGPATLPAVASA